MVGDWTTIIDHIYLSIHTTGASIRPSYFQKGWVGVYVCVEGYLSYRKKSILIYEVQ
jgi:hypothetical protein